MKVECAECGMILNETDADMHWNTEHPEWESQNIKSDGR